MKNLIWIGSLLLFLTGIGEANEKYEKPSFWLDQDYTEVKPSRLADGAKEVPKWEPHSLLWPVAFQDSSHSMGNSMAEFQSYGDGPYFHGGCDLRVRSGAPVHTPVEGRIEAGHYGYSNQPDGSSTKYWYPWPSKGDRHYFEVAVITDDGYRFEFHHLDELHLPDTIQAILKNGGGHVQAGAWLGNTIVWPDGVYHHTHYNILTPSKVSLNPEYYSTLLDDHEGPVVSGVMASFRNGRTVDFGNGQFSEVPEFFALATVDHEDGNIYDHPPVLAGIESENGKSFVWDFRERLSGPDGRFPPIWDFFIESIQSPNGPYFSTEGGFGEGVSVIRVPVPAGAQGKFTLQVGDQAGNVTQFHGMF